MKRNIAEPISMDEHLHRRLKDAVESTINSYMYNRRDETGPIDLDAVVRQFVHVHTGMIDLALWQLFDHWWVEVVRGMKEQHKQERRLDRVLKPYWDVNPNLTVGEAMALEEERLKRLEKKPDDPPEPVM